jgi:ribonuclease HI
MDQGALFDIEDDKVSLIATRGPVVVAGTDGSCEPNPGTAAGAWYVSADCWGAVVVPGIGTNNIGELVAIRALLRAVNPDRPLEIVYDSQYAHDCLTVWIRSWSKGGRLPPAQWRRGKLREPVKNADLIADTHALLASRTVTWTKARAHVAIADGGHVLNQHADERAGAVVRALASGVTPDLGPGWTRD